VAEPILAQSKVLDDETLLDCIASKGQEHLLAIATRTKLGEKISDQLVIKGDINVLGALANNAGATISDPGFKMLVQKSLGDDWLSEAVARRADIPEHHFRELVSKASEIVRQRLMANNPEHREIIQEIFGRNAASSASKSPGLSKDYRTAELVVNSRPLTEAVVNEFKGNSKKLLSRLHGYRAYRRLRSSGCLSVRGRVQLP
jgi:hypothetical protein